MRAPDQCLLVKCEPVDMTTGATVPVYVSAGAGPHTYGGTQWADAVLGSFPKFERQAFSVEQGLGGRSLPTYAALVLKNDRRRQDALVRLAWDGRPISMWRGPVGAPFDDFTPLMKGAMDQPTFDGGKITVPIRDVSAYFDRPALISRYAGTGGYEGDAALAGREKPRLAGFVSHLEPVLINAALQIYQVAEGGMGTLGFTPFERGKAFGIEATSDVFAWAQHPTGGSVGVDYNRGVYALGAVPKGIQTCSAGTGPLNDTHAGLVVNILQQWLDFSFQPTIDLAALGAFGLAVPGRAGLYLREGSTTVAKCLDDVATSAGAWWGTSPTGTFTMRQWAWGAPVATLKQGRDFRAQLKADPVELPVTRFFFRWARKYHVFTETELGDVHFSDAPATNLEDRAELQREWRFAARPGSTDSHRLLGRELTIDSLYSALNLVPAVVVAAAAMLKLLSQNRWRLPIDVALPYASVAIGDTVRLDTPRYGFGGTDWLVTGKSEQIAADARNDKTTVRLWGPRAEGE